jgi:hypothetical protein
MIRLGAALARAALLLVLASVAEPTLALEQEEAPASPTEIGEAPIFGGDRLSYRPGRGLRLEDAGIVLGGFATAEIEREDGEAAEFSLENVDFFLIFDHFSRFRAVAEVEFDEPFLVTDEGGGGASDSFHVRRLFGDFILSDYLHVRLGTFLTPVGYWNLILAPPLTWTTEPPLIVDKTVFDLTSTGPMLYGSTGLADGRLSYAVYAQVLEPIGNDQQIDPDDYRAGARLEFDMGPGWTVGASYLASERDGNWSHLEDLHFFWQRRPFELLAEALYQDGAGSSSRDWGAYLQGVYQVYGPFHAVARYEHFAPPHDRPQLNLFTIGAALKPFPFMALKVEYRFSDRSPAQDLDQNPVGFFSSFSTFF